MVAERKYALLHCYYHCLYSISYDQTSIKIKQYIMSCVFAWIAMGIWYTLCSSILFLCINNLFISLFFLIVFQIVYRADAPFMLCDSYMGTLLFLEWKIHIFLVQQFSKICFFLERNMDGKLCCSYMGHETIWHVRN